MSVSSALSHLRQVQSKIDQLNRKVSDFSSIEARLARKIAARSKSLSGARLSPSTTASKQRELHQAQDELARTQSKRADTSKEIADLTAKLHRAQQAVHVEQAKEQKQELERIVRLSRKREAELLQELRDQVSDTTSKLHRTADTRYDAFISHATEDKEEIARPLAESLRARGLVIWYDEFQLRVGDSLRRSIDFGLANSRFGIVILSPAFFSKNWTQYELDGLVAKENSGGKVILPLWHRLSKDDVMRVSPTLGDRVALSTASFTIDELAIQLSEALKSATLP